MTIVCYPTPNKAKAKDVLQAFADGCGGILAPGSVRDLCPNDAAFFGVTPATLRFWHQAKQTGVDWYYLDNAYLDPCRQTFFRATKNRLQAFPTKDSDGKRFEALNLPIEPWRKDGRHVLVCPQSDEFMEIVAEYRGNWTNDTVAALKKVTDRPIRVRPWDRDKARWFATLHEDLEDCWAVVVFSSSSALTALRAGVPAYCTAYDCIAAPYIEARPEQDIMTLDIDSIDRSWDRRPLFYAAADNQWTLAEMKAGVAWRHINGQ